MQISLKLIQLINHAKLTIYIKFQLLVTFSSLFTGSSSLSVFPRGVLYVSEIINDETNRMNRTESLFTLNKKKKLNE